MKRTNWWFEGWHYENRLDARGRQQKKLVYHGEYYTFGLDKKHLRLLKAGVSILVILILVSYVLTFTLTETAVSRIFVGACMLIVIPFMYLLIGAASLLKAKNKLTFRDYRGSVVRIRWSVWTIAVLSMIGLIGEAVNFLSGGSFSVGEGLWLTGVTVTCAGAVTLGLLMQHNWPQLIPPELK